MAVARFMRTDGRGNVSLLKESSDWRDTWQILLPVQLRPQLPPAATMLFLYDRVAGAAKFLNTDEDGETHMVGAHTNWKKSWDVIVPGNFGDAGGTDLLLYRRDAGEAKFLTTAADGNVSLLKQHIDWNTSWDIIVPGKFGASNHTDLLLYEQGTGLAKFLTTDGFGNIATLNEHDWHAGWDYIVPGHFSKSAFTDLLFYRRSDGLARIYTTNGSGNITKLRELNWQPGWDFIVPGKFSDSPFTGLLFYRRSDGLAKLFATDGEGNITLLKEHTWRRVWDAIVPGNFGGSKFTDVLLYSGRLNRAAAIGWRGCVDTDLRFSEFFSSNHTVVSRFMLQYPLAYAGPICAENGVGNYFIGQDNFQAGDSYATRLRLQVGSKVKQVPIASAGESQAIASHWQHIAVVRTGNTFKVFFNGMHQPPDLVIGANELGLPSSDSTLRLGRRTDGGTVGGREAQFYGLLDDVAVFSKALTQAEISAMVSAGSKRLDGGEAGLVAAWTFDPTTPSGASLPAALNRPVTFQSLPGAAGRAAAPATLSPSKDDDYDGALQPRPGLRLKVPLPSPPDEIWRVVSPNSAVNSTVDPVEVGSHVGFACFAMDLQKALTGGGGERIRAVTAGTVKEVVDTDDLGNNIIVIEQQPGLPFVMYMHNAKGSSKVKVGDAVTVGQHIADVGEAEGHLHLAMHSQLGSDLVTVPFAFQAFDVCTPGGAQTCTAWTRVRHELPLDNRWIKHV